MALSLMFLPRSKNLYGTSADAVKAVIEEQRKVCLIDINVKSVLKVT